MSTLLPNTIRYLNETNRQVPLYTMNPIEERSRREKFLRTKCTEGLSNVTKKDVSITVRDGHSITLRIYTPKGKGPFPINVYYHGGGWVLNSIETCNETCELLAEITKSIVVSVNYRLAPEFKFPTPVFDAYDAFLWTVENKKFLNGTNQILVAGDSAGGNLATVVTLLNRDLQGSTIHAQVLLYPVTDLTFSTASYEEFAVGYGLLKEDMAWFKQHYLNNEDETYHQYVSPLLAKDLTNLPSAFIIVAENDVLRDEGIAYAKKLEDSGGKVKLRIAQGLVHSYFTKNEYFQSQIKETINEIQLFISSLSSLNE